MKEKRETNFPPDSQVKLKERLDRILSRRLVQKLDFAFDRHEPVKDSHWYIRPRIMIPVEAAQRLTYASGNGVVDRDVPTGEAVYALPNGWTRPNWDKPFTSYGVVFRMGFTRFIQSTLPGDGKRVFPPQLWFHTSRPLSVAGEHALQAMNALARTNPQSAAVLPLFYVILRIARDELEAESKEIGEARRTWTMLCEYIQEHCADSQLNRMKVARVFNLHPNYISRLFTEQGKESFNQFTNHQRLDRATALLHNPALTVKEAAAQSGFGSSSYFIRIFCKVYGMTPVQFRARARESSG
jgi:AraC-like DNA-binding protein